MTRLRKVAACGFVLLWSAVGCGGRTPSAVPLGGQDEPGTPSAEEDPSRSVSEGAPHGPKEPTEPEPEDDSYDDEAPEHPFDDMEDPDDSEDDDEDDDDEEEEDQPLRTEATLASNAPSPACDDSQPRAFDCRPLTRSCPSLAPLCKAMESTLKPKIAQSLADCVAEAGCALQGTDTCVRSALRNACVDEEARSFCADRHEKCRAEFEKAQVSREDCEYAVSALLPRVRTEFTACLADSCDPEPCLVRLLPGAG